MSHTHKARMLCRLALAWFLLTGVSSPAATIDFSDLNLAASSYWNGSTLTGGFTTGNAFFNNAYDTNWGSWSGWSYSNITDNTTAGYGNQYSAITGSGILGTNSIYAIANSYSPNDAFINLPSGSQISSIQVTNATYAYFSMLNGDQFSTAFSANSYFYLTVRGFDAPGATGNVTGSVDFYLADYRFASSSQYYIVNTWKTLDLSSLASNTASLGFELTSSDVGPYGMNTPSYFALGAVELTTPVPEPSSMMLGGIGLLAIHIVRNRRRVRI